MMAVCLIAACSSLPHLHPVPASLQQSTPAACRAVFPQGKWQFTHTIEAAFPGGAENLLMGVTVVDAPGQTLDCALMTVEGFVLFQARMGKTLQVARAMPPFDRKGFAEGLMADIRLLFIEPAAGNMQTGLSGEAAVPDAGPVCRYAGKTGHITDVRPGPGLRWQIDRYAPGGRLSRTVRAEPAGGQAGFPGRLWLKAAGMAGYALEMKLINAVHLKD